MFNSPDTHPDAMLDLKTQMTPFLSHVIVFLVNDSLQNAKEKFEVKDLVKCWWKQTIVCHH
jgi:hypothetical protein